LDRHPSPTVACEPLSLAIVTVCGQDIDREFRVSTGIASGNLCNSAGFHDVDAEITPIRLMGGRASGLTPSPADAVRSGTVAVRSNDCTRITPFSFSLGQWTLGHSGSDTYQLTSDGRSSRRSTSTALASISVISRDAQRVLS
jgi:hypothetical protein